MANVWAPRSVTLNLVHFSWKRCQCVGHMATLREIRLATSQSQRAFAAQLEIPVQTYRPLDSGRRRTPTALLDRAADILKQHRHDTELFTVDVLAREYHIHPRTLRAAARDGRLQVHFSNRAVFGRPLRLATRGAVDDFVRRFYRQRYSRFAPSLPKFRRPRSTKLRFSAYWLAVATSDVARRSCAANWRREQSRGVSVGIKEAQAYDCVLETN